MELNFYLTKYYENEIAFGLRENKPNQSQSQKQKSEDRSRKTEDKRQKTDDRRQKAEYDPSDLVPAKRDPLAMTNYRACFLA